MEKLSIFWGNYLVGTLYRHTKGRVQFQYSQDWLADIGKPISLSLPCMEKTFSPGVSTAFFENLLPESDVRSILAFNNHFDKKDTFAFLAHFGEDCAGALSIIPQEHAPDFTPRCYDEITVELISALDRLKISTDPRHLYSEMQPNRLSIAGAQDKLPVYFADEKFYLPANSGSATTHIIKPLSPIYPDIQRNEAFCMDLARSIGLRVPGSQLSTIGPHELYIIERYDRKILPDRVARIHQEDFCQAMGLPAGRKYQARGGPGFEACRLLINEHFPFQSAIVRIEMVSVLAFNFIIGNHDAHGKNFSIIHSKELEMAPYYDLLSTQVYDNLERHFAMSIGRTFRHDRVGTHSFEIFAQDMQFRSIKIAEIMDKVIQSVDRSYNRLLSLHEKQYGPAGVYHKLDRVISENLSRLKVMRNTLSGTPDTS